VNNHLSAHAPLDADIHAVLRACAVQPVAPDSERAHQFSLDLQKLAFNVTALTTPDEVSKLPFPSINRNLPERFVTVDVSDLHGRTFDFMGREKLANVINELDKLSVGGKTLRQARAQKQDRLSAGTTPTFHQMLIYGSPGWGKVTTYHIRTHAYAASLHRLSIPCRRYSP
jgi:hypothetical protein